ncbi:MAG: S24/S26 family peptidase [Pseudomonadota bacterium]
MLGWKLARISGGSMEPLLPDGSFALFRAVKRVKRSDVVLVDHPEFGVIVKKVHAVSFNGRIALRGISMRSTSARQLGQVDPDRVLGRLALRMRWGRVLPRLSGPNPIGDDAIDPGAMIAFDDAIAEPANKDA